MLFVDRTRNTCFSCSPEACFFVVECLKFWCRRNPHHLFVLFFLSLCLLTVHFFFFVDTTHDMCFFRSCSKSVLF